MERRPCKRLSLQTSVARTTVHAEQKISLAAKPMSALQSGVVLAAMLTRVARGQDRIAEAIVAGTKFEHQIVAVR